ncbi:MAG: rRNA methyltransferase [Ruminococcaceae bacterium]|nr:rRNA methyltransferase [Oscillospiraceae bacterium]
MLNLRETQKAMLTKHIKEGSAVADFTMGNGNDTLWLSNQVGVTGKVFAFDIQEAALANTKSLLEKEGCFENYTLIRESHHLLKEYIDCPLDAGIFNLGFLPGGDKALTTLRSTTLPAIEAAISLIKPGGCLMIAIYPGHEEGRLEGELICETLSGYDQKHLSAYRFNVLNAATSPYFIYVEINEKYKGGNR